MNKSLLFWGLSPIQFSIIAGLGLASLLTMVFLRLHPLVLLTIATGLIGLFILVFSKIKKANDDGNPDYIQGQIIKGATPKKITDKYLFKRLIQNQEI